MSSVFCTRVTVYHNTSIEIEVLYPRSLLAVWVFHDWEGYNGCSKDVFRSVDVLFVVRGPIHVLIVPSHRTGATRFKLVSVAMALAPPKAARLSRKKKDCSLVSEFRLYDIQM
jgi:hypothetical protein